MRIADEFDEEVSVNAFVVMQRYEIEIVESEGCGDEQDRDHTDLPNAFRDIGGDRCGGRSRGGPVSNRGLLLRFFLT